VRHRLPLALVASVGLLVLAGCGGGNPASNGLPRATTLTPAAFRAKANAICLKLYRTKIPDGPTGIEAMLPALLTAETPFEALKPPPSLAEYDVELKAVYKQLDLRTVVKKEAEAANRGNTAAVLGIALSPNVARNSGREDQLWKKIGANVCANGPLDRYTH
jgi:hypothetical protein